MRFLNALCRLLGACIFFNRLLTLHSFRRCVPGAISGVVVCVVSANILIRRHMTEIDECRGFDTLQSFLIANMNFT